MKLLGVITSATNDTENNKTTVAPFDIPKNIRAIGLQCETAGVYVSLGITDDYAAVAASSRRLAQYEWAEFRTAGIEWVVGIRNDTGGTVTVKVFAVP